MAYSAEQLNFFKFSTVVVDEFPDALRRVFAFMWDTLVATTPGVPKWDDSVTVLNIFLAKEGGVKKVPSLNKSYKEWDCTALFKATLFAQTFARPDGTGGFSTLDKLYVRPRGLSAGTFHSSPVVRSTGNQAETYALALDQLRLLRNTLCHQNTTGNIDKAMFDQYILLAKDAFTALGQDTSRIDDIGKLGEEDFPTTRLQQLEDELKKEKDAAIKFKQIDDHLTELESQVKDVGTDVKAVKSDVTDVKTQVEDVGSDVKDVKTQVKDVGSDVKDVKSDVTDVKTQVEDVGSEVKELKADVADIKNAIQVENSKAPCSCIPDKIPHFVGRQEECEAVFNQLTKGDTRLVDVWGSPGFGKTSVAINVAHQLKEMEIPVYFTSLRGMKTKDELVSKLLSIFADAKQAFYVSPSHWLIQCLQQLENPFVLILDNADDLLESEDSQLKEDVLRFTEEILAQCSQIKLFFTTRESLDYLGHKLLIQQERVGVLDKVSSVSLVKSVLPNVLDDDCKCIVNVCGQVPLAMRLMCSIMREENVSLIELLEELKDSPLVEVLDNESFADDARLKTIINNSFKRLTDHERVALVSLAVFPSSFGAEEAKAVLDLKTSRQTKEVVRSLTRKSLIDCSDNFESFTIHSLLRSFVEERRIANQEIQAMFNAAQLRFYDYHITSFGVANEKFLAGHSNDAFKAFHDKRENILLSLENGAKDDALYPKVVNVLSKAELFFYAALPNEELLFDRLYSTVVEEARKRECPADECNLLAAKSFSILGSFYKERQSWNQSLEASICDASSCPAKRLCYLGVFQLLSGMIDDGISSLRTSVGRFNSNCCDEKVLKVLACHVLTVCYRKKGDKDNASQFETSCSNECKSTSFSPVVRNLFLRDNSSAGKLTDLTSIVEQDVFFFVVVAELLSVLYRVLEFGKQAETELSTMTHHLVGLHQVLLALFDKGILHVRVLEACCNALYSLNCFKEAAEGFQMITDKLEKTQGNWHIHAAQNYLFRGLSLKELKDHEAAFCYLKKALDIRRQFLQENLDATSGNNIIRKTIDSLEHCLKMHENLEGVTFGGANDFEVICEEIKNALKSMEKVDSVDLAEIATNYNQLGCCYLILDDHDGALESYQQALKIREENVGDSVDKASCLENIGSVYSKINRYTDAGKAYQDALTLMKSLGLEDHPDTASIHHGLGNNHYMLGQLSEALNAHRQGLQLRKKHLGDHTLTANSFNLTGAVYFKMGEYEAASQNFQNAADLSKTLLGDHEETATNLNNLAETYLQIGNYRGALDACQEARDIRLKVLGDHLDTATSFQCSINSVDLAEIATNYNQLGCCYLVLGDYNGALESYQQALKIREEHMGDSVDKASCLQNMASVYFKMNQFTDAGKAYQDALTLMKSLGLEDHPDTASIHHGIGTNHYTLGQLSEALNAHQQGLQLRKKHLGDHTLTAQSFNQTGAVYFKMGEYEAASQYFQNAADLSKKLLGDHEETVLNLHNLAESYLQMGNYRGALDACQEARDIRLKVLGDHLDTATSFQCLGVVFFKMRDFKGAVRSFRRASALRSKLLGDHVDTALSYHCLGKAQMSTGDFSGALESLRKALSIRKKEMGSHPDTAATLELLKHAHIGQLANNSY